MNCIIVDDEPLAIQLLEGHIARVPALKLVGKCTHALEAFDLLQQQQVDVMFLDIQMPDLNGIQFLQSLQYKPRTIFTTAYREYAVDGFELEAVDYLLKPITFERFFKAVSRVIRSQNEIQIQVPMDDHILLRSDGLQHKVPLKTIRFMESQGNDIKVFLTNGTALLVKLTISDMAADLQGKGFVRVHRSFLVNARLVTAFNQSELLIGEFRVPVGRSFKGNAMQLVKELSLRAG